MYSPLFFNICNSSLNPIVVVVVVVVVVHFHSFFSSRMVVLTLSSMHNHISNVPEHAFPPQY